jgi:leucyl-tRNA synthetase
LANFVLDNYGEGAIFGCPAHDERDFEFAQKYNLEVIKVVECDNSELPYPGDGMIINSENLNGLNKEQGISAAIEMIEKRKIGKKAINYKLRDWGVSRQRYWGCPIPVIYYEDGSYRVLDKSELPVELPYDVNLDGRGNALLKNESWRKIKCSKTGKIAFKETDTLDTFVDSSWYYIRFLNNNASRPFNNEDVNKYLPVDKYIGGIEHAILHLLYSRFFTKALRDVYGFNVDEPFKQLFTQGMITHKTFQNHKGEWIMPKSIAINDGKIIDLEHKKEVKVGATEKMSKSKKNVVEPNEILENYGINATRIFMISDSPPDRELEWTDDGIQSSKNLINRIEKYFSKDKSIINKLAIKEIEKFVFNMEKNILNFSLNKCVANIYTLINFLEKQSIFLGNNELSKKILITINPIIPSLSSKIFKKLFFSEIGDQLWPELQEELLIEEKLKLPIQINGKVADLIEIDIDYTEKKALEEIYKRDKIINKINGKNITKIINVQNKIINLII